MKPIKPVLVDDDYKVDALIREGTLLSAEVQTTLRNLLLGCELGCLVVVQCTRIEDGTEAFILCAYAETSSREERILPICVLDATANLSVSYRPPPYTARKGNTKMVRTHFSDKHIEPKAVEDGVIVLAEPTIGDESVH